MRKKNIEYYITRGRKRVSEGEKKKRKKKVFVLSQTEPGLSANILKTFMLVLVISVNIRLIS